MWYIFARQSTGLQEIRIDICLEESEIIREYRSLTEEKWFNAKELLDERLPGDMEDISKLELLCDIIEVSKTLFYWPSHNLLGNIYQLIHKCRLNVY